MRVLSCFNVILRLILCKFFKILSNAKFIIKDVEKNPLDSVINCKFAFTLFTWLRVV